jgi:hypothetical protein
MVPTGNFARASYYRGFQIRLYAHYRTRCVGDQHKQGKFLHRTTQTHKLYSHTSVPPGEFEPTISVSERYTTVYDEGHTSRVIVQIT